MDDATATMAPARPQHMQALERANAVRLARAGLKRRVGNGSITVTDVIVECPWEAASMTIAELLTSQRRWGATRCSKFLAQPRTNDSHSSGGRASFWIRRLRWLRC